MNDKLKSGTGWKRLWWALGLVLAICLLFVAATWIILSQGMADRFVTERASAALKQLAGPDFQTGLGGARVGLGSGGLFTLRAQGVTLRRKGDKQPAITADAIHFALPLTSLIRGRADISVVRINDIAIDLADLAPSSEVIKGNRQEDDDGQTINAADLAEGSQALIHLLKDRGVKRLEIVHLRLRGGGILPLPNIDADQVIVSRKAGGLDLAMVVGAGQADLKVSGRLQPPAGGKNVPLLHLTVAGLPTSMVPGLRPSDFVSLDSEADITFDLIAGQTDAATAAITIALAEAPLVIGSGSKARTTRLGDTSLRLDYDMTARRLLLQPTRVAIGGVLFDLDGEVEMASPFLLSPTNFRFSATGGNAAPTDSPAPPVEFTGNLSGNYQPSSRLMTVDSFSIETQDQQFNSAASIQLGDASPAIAFSARTAGLSVAAVKQFWPIWIAHGARRWILQNVTDGQVGSGSIDLFIPPGRLGNPEKPLRLNSQELQLAFNIEDADFDLPDSLPPVTGASGQVRVLGQKAMIDLDGGSILLESGERIVLADTSLTIPRTRQKPLMAELVTRAQGDAGALMDFASNKPIDASRHVDFTADDLSGPVSAQIAATFGLVPDQSPPPPVWRAMFEIDGVSLSKPIAGQQVTQAVGTIDLDASRAIIDVDAHLNDLAAEIVMTRPFGEDSQIELQQSVRITLDDEDRKKLLPGLEEILKGTITLDIEGAELDPLPVVLDLTNASLALPWVGWNKGKGIAAKANFDLTRSPGRTELKNFALSGNGFSASGSMVADGKGLVSASMSQVVLAPGDQIGVDIKRSGSGYTIKAKGQKYDGRSVLQRLLKKDKPSGQSSSKTSLDLDIQLDALTGFNGAQLKDVRISYRSRGSKILGLTLNSSTPRGSPVQASLDTGGKQTRTRIATGDAGSVLRFLDLYDHMQGGTVSGNLMRTGDGPEKGTVKIRDFVLVNEPRLAKLVSSPPRGSNKSLSEAARRKLDSKRVAFDTGMAVIEKGKDYFVIREGVVRGQQMGTTFKGLVYDARKNIDITGTFMPAYGLNRLFGELPLIGQILGNGRDKALIGITYRLSGKGKSPDLEVNPLSLIAPGVFRSIFEYR